LFGISRQGYYQKQQRIDKRLKELSQVKADVIKERIHLPRLGTRKLYYRLSKQIRSKGIKIGRDALFDFLRSEHMLIRPKHGLTIKPLTQSIGCISILICLKASKHPDLTRCG
jgi:putative transposase